jgi:hypothetical protein
LASSACFTDDPLGLRLGSPFSFCDHVHDPQLLLMTVTRSPLDLLPDVARAFLEDMR